METNFLKNYFHQTRRWLAKNYLRLYPRLKIIGITGSYGKTNTTRAIAAVLAEKYQVLATDLDLDTIYNLPITILKLRLGHQVLVLEYGVDYPGEMDFHLSLVKPKIGVLTGFTPVHSDRQHLGSLKNIIQEKTKLLRSLPVDGWTILNWDDEDVRKVVLKLKSRIVRCGINKYKCDWWAEKIKVDFSGTEFMMGHHRESITVKTGLIGRHFVHACLVAAAAGDLLGLTLDQIKSGLEKLKPLRGRMSIEPGPRRTILLNDALRANPASTIAGLQTLAELPTKRKLAILGEMGELGSFEKKGHQLVGARVAELKIDYFIGVGPLQKYAVESALKKGRKKERTFWAPDVLGAANILKKILQPGDLLYLKGSLLRHMERVVLFLERKKIDCRLVSCDHYQPCYFCPRLVVGKKV